jgi:Gpi18-like mannosyltransferase
MGSAEARIARRPAAISRAGWLTRLGPEWRAALGVATLVRLAFFTIGIAASWFLLDRTTGAPTLGFEAMWRWWDAHHLLTIAEVGYTAPESDAHAAAFFPAYPLAVRPLIWLGLSPVLAGMLVSAAAAVVAGAFLYRLAEEEIGEGAGQRALLYLSVFPTAVFLVAPYSESLFLAGAIAAFYLARRGRWHLVGLPAAVAVGSRAAGIFLLIGLILEFARQKNFSGRRLADVSFALSVAILPLLAYGAFLGRAMGNPLMFLVHQQAGWGRSFVGPVASFLNTWNTWDVATYPTNWLLAWRLEVLAAAVGTFFVAWALLKREWGYAGFMGSLLAALMTSTWYYSVPRMLLTMFPIVLFLAEVTKRRPSLHDWLLIGLAPLATLGVVVYTQGGWFY